MIDRPPRVGQNRHDWLFTLQARLIRQGFTPESVESCAAEMCRAWGWEDRLPEVAANTAKILSGVYRGGDDKIQWPDPNDEARRARFSHPRLFEPADTGLTAEAVLPALFPNNPLVCIGRTEKRYSTRPLSALLPHAAAAPFIVPNAMTAEKGLTGKGELSCRSKANSCGEDGRRWAVIEFDTHDSLPDQCAVLSSLDTLATPLCMAVYSGGKSIHGWFNVAGLSRLDKRRFFQFARFLGADFSLWDTSKLVRMPGGVRSNGNKQSIFYFNGKAVSQ